MPVGHNKGIFSNVTQMPDASPGTPMTIGQPGAVAESGGMIAPDGSRVDLAPSAPFSPAGSATPGDNSPVQDMLSTGADRRATT